MEGWISLQDARAAIRAEVTQGGTYRDAARKVLGFEDRDPVELETYDEATMHREEVRLVAWTDGGGGTSTPDLEAYIGVFVVDEATGEVLWRHAAGIGRTTHNVAEYTAVLTAIRYAAERGATHLLVRSDSRLVVNQITGQFRVTKPHLAALLAEVREAAEALDFQIEWVPREENKVADELTRGIR